MQLAFHSQGASRMVRFFQWPWTTGQCSSPYCIHNKPMPIIQCWFCYLQYCEECDRITACYRCGKPACAYCYQAHDCQPEDLLSRHPWLKCRICPAPQDRVQPACEECGEPLALTASAARLYGPHTVLTTKTSVGLAPAGNWYGDKFLSTHGVEF